MEDEYLVSVTLIRRKLRLHVSTGIGTVFSRVKSQRSSARKTKPEREIDYLIKIRNAYCAQKQNTFQTVRIKQNL
jgi:hypothetical protein